MPIPASYGRSVPPSGDPTNGVEFSTLGCFKYSFDLFIRHWLFLTLFMLIYIGGSLLVNFIPIIGFFTMFAAVVLLAGACKAVIEAERRGKKAEFVEMFNGFKTIRGLEVALEVLILTIIVLVAMIPAVVGTVILIFAINQASTGGSSIQLWIMSLGLITLSIIITTFFQLRLMMAMIVSMDKIETEPFNPISSLNAGWDLTRGHTLGLFAIWFVVTLISFLSVLALCVGYFLVAMQLTAATLVATYLLLLPPSQRGGRFADKTTCPWCAYDLSDTAGALCPECGLDHPARVQQTQHEAQPAM